MKRLVLLGVLVLAGVATGAGQSAGGRGVDLVTGRIDGHPVLGRTVAGVTASLGRPDFRVGGGRLYRLGWGTPTRFSFEVLFRRSNGVLRAWSVVFAQGPVRDSRIGDLLGRRPVALQAAIRSRYADSYKLLRGYRCDASGTCVVEFAQRAGPLHLTFGSQHSRGTWFSIWTTS